VVVATEGVEVATSVNGEVEVTISFVVVANASEVVAKSSVVLVAFT
jgi:hypothetical protein